MNFLMVIKATLLVFFDVSNYYFNRDLESFETFSAKVTIRLSLKALTIIHQMRP